MRKVYFVGAGPGDPELITVKGKKSLETADIIIYAGSLVNPELLTYAKKETEIYNSASMTLEEVLAVMKQGYEDNKKIVRLHTGDPSIYGAIREQMDALEKKNIAFEVIPGVSSFVASAASIKKEFTLPGVSQTVILTRVEGRTKVPKLEQLDKLAAHQTSMAIFLSVQMIDKVVEKLLSHYSPETKIAVIQKASWPDEKIVMGTLTTIADDVKKANITKTAQILVGDFLGDQYELSKLYDKTFSHEYRQAKK
jgi:precorrin-4/cobalt-precorrin-4 C11-methyltransferase